MNYIPNRFVKIFQCERPKQKGHEFRNEWTYVTVKRYVSTTQPRPNAAPSGMDLWISEGFVSRLDPTR
jgi:hypothetical protein